MTDEEIVSHKSKYSEIKNFSISSKRGFMMLLIVTILMIGMMIAVTMIKTMMMYLMPESFMTML